MLLKLYVKFQDLMSREEGQDLVEYALVVALIALGAVAGWALLPRASTLRSRPSAPLLPPRCKPEPSTSGSMRTRLG
jgi:Flp pilus assembly pilin Flp